jgi:hypothetical protein
MEVQLLREQEIYPSEEVLRNVLGQVYDVLAELETCLTVETDNTSASLSTSYPSLRIDWNYYNDGKSWLCKVCHKKKTVFWLSVWEGYFQTGFFFLERHLEGIAALDISEQIKGDFCRMKHIGKLIPMVIKINKQEQLADVLKVVKFKKEAK